MSCSSKNSSTPTAEKKPDQIDGGKSLRPSPQVLRVFIPNWLTVFASAAVDFLFYVFSLSRSSTATADKKPDQTDGGSGTMTVTTSGSSNQVNPFQAIGQNGGNVTVGGTYHAPSGDPTRGRDIPIGTGQKGE